MLSLTARSRIPTDLDIEPSVIMYDTADNASIPVHVNNITTNTVTIYFRALLVKYRSQNAELSAKGQVIENISYIHSG